MDKNNGIMIFKDIFEYYKDGDLNEEGFCELMMLIYETKWGTEPDINNIQNRMCKTIWKGLRHSIKKSVRNAKYQNNKSTLQEVKSTEFDTPQIEENVENENKADLNPSKPLVDNLYHPEGESASNGLKISKEEILEEDIINILNDSDIMSNPTNIRLDKETGKYYTDEKVKEIREKVEKSNNNPLPIVENNMPTWEDYLKSINGKLRDIINDLNSDSRIRRTIQAPTNLKELLNSRAGRYYKDRVLEIIERYTTQQAVA